MRSVWFELKNNSDLCIRHGVFWAEIENLIVTKKRLFLAIILNDDT